MHDHREADTRADLRAPLIFCAVLGAILLGASVLIAYIVPREYFWKFAIALCGVYVAVTGISLISCLVRYHKAKQARKESDDSTEAVGDLFRYVIDMPYAIMDEEGVVKIASGELQKILKLRNPVCNVPLSSFCSINVEHVIHYAREGKPFVLKGENDYKVPTDTTISMQTDIEGKTYDVKSHIMHSHGREYYFVIFQDITELLNVKQEHYDSDPVVVYIALDSLQELAQYIRVSYRTAVNEVEGKLKDWATDLGGVLREYDREKYMMVITRAAFDKCQNNKFHILDIVRNIKLGDNTFPATLSIGFGIVKGSMEEKGEAASRALDIALQKGGDQVCVYDGERYSSFGGHVNTMYGSNPVTSRVNSTYLQKLMREAGNVLIMGHRNPDYDSIGSCVGLARLAICSRGSTAKIRVVVDRENANFRTCYDMLAALPEYRSMFISADTAMDAVLSDTLLVLSDVNSGKNVESLALLQRVKNIVIIDHHRRDADKSEKLVFAEPIMPYIDPHAAAASELVCEMLEYSPYRHALLKEEANLLLAGLMLDTKNFVSGAGIQTFDAVRYLYQQNAHADAIRNFFTESLEERFLAMGLDDRTRIYRDKIALTWLSIDREATETDMIAVAKAADKLMTLTGVEAAFALLRTGDMVKISARSKDKINVELIMKSLGGGGHFGMAAATMFNTNLESASSALKKAIDKYLDNDYNSGSVTDTKS